MSPFKSSAGRALGKMLEGYKSSDIGKGFGAGSGGDLTVTGGTNVQKVLLTEITHILHLLNQVILLLLVQHKKVLIF